MAKPKKVDFKYLEYLLGKDYKTERMMLGVVGMRIDTWPCGCIRTGTAKMSGGIGTWKDKFTPCEKHKKEFGLGQIQMDEKEQRLFQLKLV